MISAFIIGAVVILIYLFFTAQNLFGREESNHNTAPSSGGLTTLDIINNYVGIYSREFGVSSSLIKAIIRTESSFNPNAVNSSDPSYGLMGIMPILAQDYGYVKDWRKVTAEEIAGLKQIDVNIYIGTKHLKNLLANYLFDEAIQMYNVGIKGYKDGRRNSSYLSKVMKYYKVMEYYQEYENAK